jgi:hypothetical protein
VDRLSDRAPGQLPLLRRVGPGLALGEALLGLQQPTKHQQLAHQVIQGLAGGLPVRIGDRWYHRWWVMLGGVLLGLIVGALALGAFQS